MKKLYEVEILCYVMAEDEDEAKFIAIAECQIGEADAHLPVSIRSDYWDSIPHGASSDKTCGKMI